MTLDSAILVTCSSAIALLGTLVFIRNPSQPTNRRFAFLSISLLAWTVFNYLSDNADENNLLFTRLTFIGGVAAIYSVLNFIAKFPSDIAFKKSILLRFHTFFTFILLPVIFLPQFIVSVSADSTGASINTSYLYLAFVVYVIYSLFLLLLIIRKQILSAKSFTQKQQILIISWGVGLYAVLAIASNVLIPSIINNWSISRFGPVFTLLFVGMVAYSIAKHSLFDIRLVIARSIVYVLLFATLAAIFASSILALTSLFFGDQNVSAWTEAIFVIVALLVVFLLQPLKRFFDRITNKIFYRDAYDAQELLNNLNRSLVATIDLEELLTKSAQIVGNTLKTESCKFVIRETDGKFRTIGTHKNHLDDRSIGAAILAAEHSSERVIVTDELEPRKTRLKEAMQKIDTTVFVKIHDKHSNRSQHQSYILLGQKKSGGLYSSQDIRILEIIADELVIAIQNSLRFEEIQRFNITLQQKINEATKELRRVNARLRELDKTKDEFISMASHQLRTPLTTVKGYLSMVLDGDTGSVKKNQKEMVQKAFSGAQKMVYLIGDMLNVSRLQTGKFVIENQPTNLANLVAGEIAQLQETAEGHLIKLIYHKPDKFPVLNLDDNKIRQVVMNFLDNAIYYTPTNGSVTVDLNSSDKEVQFTVTDTGIGIPAAVQHHLFSKFYRADNARKMRPDGTGLGLFMAKKVITAQGGAIIFKSTEGKGSTFGFSFPRHAMEAKDKKPAEKSATKQEEVVLSKT